MTGLAELLGKNELFLLFFTVLAGLVLGRLRFKGVTLGVAGVLFAGLGLSAAFGTKASDLRIAPELKELGLVLFVYMVGLTSAPGFFTAFRKSGVRFNTAALAALASAALLTFGAGQVFGLGPGMQAGLFAGALTNTPALAAASDRLAGTKEALDPILAYSITYPFGVIAGLLAFRGFWALSKRRQTDGTGPVERQKIASATCVVDTPEAIAAAIGELKVRDALGVLISRVRRGTALTVPTKYTRLAVGDVITIVGEAGAVERAVAYFGALVEDHLDDSRRDVDMRRILVSRRKFVGKRIEGLDLPGRFNAQVTRLRRADIDLVPSDDMRLELGDRLRIVAPRANLPAVAQYFGDSERELAAVDFIALSLGLSLGLLVAKIPIPLFGTTVSLGIAGGPLLVALLLGWLGRTGPLAWSIPYETNTALRELGILLFLAGVGVSAGSELDRVSGLAALRLFGIGAVITLTSTAVALGVLRKFARATVISALGATSGVQTQPAILAAAYEMVGRREEIYVAYAITYPVAMIGKILLAQVLASG